MKKIISITMSLMLIFSATALIYAESSNDVQQEESNVGKQEVEEQAETVELNLEDAIEYALNNNIEIKIQDLNIGNEELAHEQTMNDVEDYEDFQDLSDEDKEELIAQNPALELPIVNRKLFDLGVVERSTKLSLQIANWNKEIKINEIKYNVEKGYFDLLQAQKELEIAKEGLELAKKQYEQSKLMYDLGTISQQQLIAIELGVSQAQAGVDGANMAYELQKMNFNNTLGLTLDRKVALTDSIEYKEHEEIILEASIEEALDNNVSLAAANENYDLSKLTLQATKARYPEITYRYREQAIVVETAAKNLESAKTGIEMGVRAAHLSLTTAEKQITTYEMAVSQAEKALELAQVSFELGQNTANDVNQSMIELMTSKKNLAKQIHAYNTALLDFKYSTGLGKTQIGGGY